MFKPIWSKQHIGIENEMTTFDLCVAGYQIAKGLQYLASRKVLPMKYLLDLKLVFIGGKYVRHLKVRTTLNSTTLDSKKLKC